MKVKVIKIANTNKRYEPEFKKNRKAGYLADKEKTKQQILSIYYEYDGRPGYRMMQKDITAVS